MRLGLAPRFGALLAPNGLHIVEYRRGRRGLEIRRTHRHDTPATSIAEAAERLADLIRSAGGRGGRVAVALTGFGSCHTILALPPAKPELLRPVITRELLRFFPDLQDPLVEFVAVGASGDGAGAKQEFLAGAARRETVGVLQGVLADREITLEHVTVLPRVLQRLRDSVAAGPEGVVLAVLPAAAPALGFFHEGGLRLFSEPLMRSGDARRLADVVPEQVERGLLFVRQQFHGATIGRLLLAAEPAEHEALSVLLGGMPGLRVERLGPGGVAPGALLALGAALDARDPAGLNLLPPGLRPPRQAERLSRALGAASAAVLALAAVGWAWTAVRAEARARDSVRELEQQLEERVVPLAAVRPVIDERQAHNLRLAFLAGLQAERMRLQDLLRAVALAAPAAIRLDHLSVARVEADWHVALAGRAEATTSAVAVRAIDRLFRELPRRIPVRDLTLDQLADATGAADEAGGDTASAGAEIVAIAFEISFIVRAEEAAAS